jgi:plasmid stabilization system protein ParE
MVKEKHFTPHWSLFAQENLKDLYLYIKSDSPQNAVKVRAGIIALAKSLTDFPLKYEECAELPTKNKIYRKATYAPCKIVYRIKGKRIEILSVFHSSQNPRKLSSVRKIKA